MGKRTEHTSGWKKEVEANLRGQTRNLDGWESGTTRCRGQDNGDKLDGQQTAKHAVKYIHTLGGNGEYLAAN
jgi:hypothetical protein